MNVRIGHQLIITKVVSDLDKCVSLRLSCKDLQQEQPAGAAAMDRPDLGPPSPAPTPT